MANEKSSALVGVVIPSFDSLLERLVDPKKMDAAKREVLKTKKEAQLSAATKTAKIKVIEAQSRLEDALLSEHADAAAAVKECVDAQRTYDFYLGVYNALFPNA